MNSSLAGKRALVTGSTSGIGLAVAHALAVEGATVMLNGFGTPEVIEAARASVAAAGTQVSYTAADLSKPEEIAALITATEAAFGGIDILVNNAGIQHVAPIEEFPPERWDSILAINLSAAFHTMRLAVPGMRARGWGRIVNTASTHGLVASVQKAGYVAAKHGLVGLTKVVALETAGSGITCNAVCPGWVRTELVQRQIEARTQASGLSLAESASELLLEKQPSGEFVTPEQIAGMVVFLCSPTAEQITGAALTIDGGWTAQ